MQTHAMSCYVHKMMYVFVSVAETEFNISLASKIQHFYLDVHCLFNYVYSSELPHDKTNNVAVRPAKAQISLGIFALYMENFKVQIPPFRGYLLSMKAGTNIIVWYCLL